MLTEKFSSSVNSHMSRFTLLTLPTVEISFRDAQANDWANTAANSNISLQHTTGALSVEYVTQANDGGFSLEKESGELSASEGQDVTLVFRINDIEIQLPKDPIIHYERDERFLLIDGSVRGRRSREEIWFDEVVLSLGEPKDNLDREDLETFDIVLSQYGVLKNPEHELSLQNLDGTVLDSEDVPMEDLRGHLLLVDEENGHVLGTLADQYNFREDPSIAAGGYDTGKEPEPVILDLPSEKSGDEEEEVVVSRIPSDERDVLMKGATIIRYAILQPLIFGYY